MGKFQILNHVNPGKSLGEMMGKRFGFSLSDVHDSLKGDSEKIKQLGVAAEQGRTIVENAHQIEQAVREVIEGTAALSKVKANILKEAAKGGKVINKALVDAYGANQDYEHARDELAIQFGQDNQHALTGHQQRMARLKNSHTVRMYVGEVDHQHQTVSLANSLYLKQIQENERHKRELNNHHLQSGSKSNPDLINRRDYVESMPDPSDEGFGSKLKRFLSNFGA